MLISIFMVSCASAPKLKGENTAYLKKTGPEFFGYWSDFVTAHQKYLGYLPEITAFIDFKKDQSFDESIGGTTVTVWGAQCRIYGDGTREVWINEKRWFQYGMASKKRTVFHELGHCVLDRLHDDTMINGYKASIMHTNSSGTLYPINYSDFRDQTNELYLRELFTEDKSGWQSIPPR